MRPYTPRIIRDGSSPSTMLRLGANLRQGGSVPVGHTAGSEDKKRNGAGRTRAVSRSDSGRSLYEGGDAQSSAVR